MEIAYLMAGKVFKTDGSVENLNDLLYPYNLVANADDEYTATSVRRTSDNPDFERYSVEHSIGDSANDPKEFCVGKIIDHTGYRKPNVVETTPQNIEGILREVNQDIPDAKVLVFSHWV